LFPVYPVELVVAYAGATSPDDVDDGAGFGASFGFVGGAIPAGKVPRVWPEDAGLGGGGGVDLTSAGFTCEDKWLSFASSSDFFASSSDVDFLVEDLGFFGLISFDMCYFVRQI
jgi:hypothetical protein